MVWISLSLLAAVFTALTSILAKLGIRQVNSNFATCYRTGIVVLFSLLLCIISGSIKDFPTLHINNWVFLILSGIATGCSWLCYYKAIQIGNINQVIPIDKSGFIFTTILFMIFFFDDTTKHGDLVTIIMLLLSMLLMFLGTRFMVEKQAKQDRTSKYGLLFAILSTILASFVSLFIKIGLNGVSSDLGTFIRTIIVLIFSFGIVLFHKDYLGCTKISRTAWICLSLSGIATGCAWLCEYSAYNIVGVNPVAVNSIGKLSLLLTMFFSYFILKERFTKKTLIGLGLLTLGILLIIFFSL